MMRIAVRGTKKKYIEFDLWSIPIFAFILLLCFWALVGIYFTFATPLGSTLQLEITGLEFLAFELIVIFVGGTLGFVYMLKEASQ